MLKRRWLHSDEVVVAGSGGLIQLFEDGGDVVVGAGDEEGFAFVLAKEVAFLAEMYFVGGGVFVAGGEHELGEFIVALGGEAEAGGVVDGFVDHLVGQGGGAGYEWSVTEEAPGLILVARGGVVGSGKGVFEAEAEFVDEIGAEADVAVGLLAGNDDFDEARLLILPVGADDRSEEHTSEL